MQKTLRLILWLTQLFDRFGHIEHNNKLCPLSSLLQIFKVHNCLQQISLLGEQRRNNLLLHADLNTIKLYLKVIAHCQYHSYAPSAPTLRKFDSTLENSQKRRG